MTTARRHVGELLGTALLLAAVVGSGIMGEKLSGGNVAIALLANTPATGAMLVTLIFSFGAVSGAHFNPAVTLADASQGGMTLVRSFTNTSAGIRPADATSFMAAQLAGAFAARCLFRWLVPSLHKQARDVVVPHTEKELSYGR